MFRRDCFVLLTALVLCPVIARASSIPVGFENLSDGTVLNDQIQGLSFGNAIVLTSGISLNEFEFPPHSGLNVASDYGGPMSISFDSPVSLVDGYFTYAEPLLFEAFNSSGQLVASASSRYSNNEALSGDAGSSPNELIGVDATGISQVVIEGDPAGGSFALDDLSYASKESPVPEPNELLPCALLLGGSLASYFHKRRNSDSKGFV